MLHRGFDQGAMFLVVNRRRFAGGADDDDAVGALVDVPVEQTPQPGQVERAVVLHRRDYCGNGTLYGLHENIRN
jgi:hypothetical protein